MARRKRRVFTREYKAEVVELIRSSGRSIGDVARELELTRTAVAEWVKQAEVDAGRGTGALTTAEREELVRLRRENRRLVMEHEILRKAAAFFAKESA